MKVVILAAGKGSRLGQSGPKPLTKLITGESILEHQLNLIQRHIPLDNVIVVVGFEKEKIIEQFPALHYVNNLKYGSTNTSKSLLLALEKCSEDVLWLNGDVVFKASVLEKALKNPRTSMVVNVGPVGEEEVKYHADAHGRILHVSKQVVDPQGEALGINYCTAADLPRLRQGLTRCSDNDYFERGIEYCIEGGMAVWSVPVDAGMCVEVDFPEDLIRANKILS